jgi:hypothetical protein
MPTVCTAAAKRYNALIVACSPIVALVAKLNR